MTPRDDPSEFYEDDEDPEKVRAAFRSGAPGVTAPPGDDRSSVAADATGTAPAREDPWQFEVPAHTDVTAAGMTFVEHPAWVAVRDASATIS